MAEYNPSKIIKDGNTYNFRDTTKIPLAGSNEISGSLIPSADGTVNLGSPSYQWNNAYIKSLTINGVACGDILTHNASEFVDVSSNQTIAGVKTFSDIPIVANGKSYISKINADRTNGTTTGFSAYNGFKIVCNNDSQGWDNTAFAIHIPEYSPTSATVAFKLYDCIVGSSSYKGFGLKKNGNDCQLFPTASNAIDLGSSTNKWKSFNGINPGALSYPNKTSYINIDTTNWDVAGGANVYTSPANGWLHIRVVGATELMVRWTGWRFGDRRVSATATDLGVTIPVAAGVTVDVVTVASGFDGKCQFFPCQGNV